MPKYYLFNSSKDNKRFMIETPSGKRIHFGSPSPPSQSYLEHNDDKIKKAWIARHSKMNEDWSRKGADKGAGFWSRYLLWSAKSIEDAIKYIYNRFGIDIVDKR